MIHIDQGGNKNRTKAFFDKLNSYGVDYDVIGQSYYPWWHGSLFDLRENMIFMAGAYKKDIILAEVAYCWRPTEYKNKNAPFPETPQGQKDFLDEVNRIVLAAPEGRGHRRVLVGAGGDGRPQEPRAFSTTTETPCP